ncbi:hypothetical protein [Gordonia sputi]|uniref:hypothetical protein n=1 Tax=Gordonia sputi TaxID=36823 RepID=UPI0036ACD9FF
MSDRPDPDRHPHAYRAWLADQQQRQRLLNQTRGFGRYAPPPKESEHRRPTSR